MMTLQKLLHPQINDNKYVHINFSKGTSYTTDPIPEDMKLPFDDIVTLLQMYVEIARGGMSESD